MAQDKIMEVRAIENGTVIDHIPSDALFKIVKILRLDEEKNRVTIGNNLESKRMGTKAIIKINDRYCAQDEINRISLVAPMAIVNIIKDYEVIQKLRVVVPETVEGFVKCMNPKCITNNEPVATAFDVVHGEEDELELRCKYCEKTTLQNQIEIIK